MITEKIFWKKIYEHIKYSGYEFLTVNEEKDDIWLVNRDKHAVQRFVLTKETAQSALFMVQKVLDHYDDIENLAECKIKQFDICFINQNILINEEMPLNIRLKMIDSLDTFKKYLNTPFSFVSSKVKPQSTSFYQRRIFNTSVIDKAMMKFNPVTLGLIISNIVIFIFMFFYERSKDADLMIEKGGLTHFNFVHGDYYRLITSIFMHFDVSHLLFNMMSLYIFGSIAEYVFKRWKYLCIYFGGGIIGNLISLTFDNVSISVGASGAICALMGAFTAYLIFSQKYDKKFIMQTFIMFIVYLLMSNIFANVNNYAHFGGLFGGLIIAVLFYLYHLDRKYFWIVSAGFGLIIILLLFNIFSEKEQNIYNFAAVDALESGNDKKASEIIKLTMDKGYDDDDTYQIYGLYQAKTENLNTAIDVWKKGLKKYPSSESLNYQLALAYRAQDEYDLADKYIKNTLKINNKDEYRKLQEEIKEFR